MRNQTKGKKKDLDYLNYFMADCLSNNITDLNQMIDSARQQISEIDSKIIEAENLKKIRCKLLTIVNILDKNKSIEEDFSKILSLFNINNHQMCKKILNEIKNQPIDITSLTSNNTYKEEIIACIKQLSENKVIINQNHFLSIGENFNNFLKFVLREV